MRCTVAKSFNSFAMHHGKINLLVNEEHIPFISIIKLLLYECWPACEIKFKWISASKPAVEKCVKKTFTSTLYNMYFVQ